MKDSQIVFVTKITQFKEMTIPEEAVHTWDDCKAEWVLPFEMMSGNVKGKGYEKIYLSRSKYGSKNPTIGEKYFEVF